jgi:hypothetical protein
VQQDAMVAVAFERGGVAAEVRFEIDGKRMGWIQSSERTDSSLPRTRGWRIGPFLLPHGKEKKLDTWVADASMPRLGGHRRIFHRRHHDRRKRQKLAWSSGQSLTD